MAIMDADSTVVYYNVSAGIVPPPKSLVQQAELDAGNDDRF